jgi:predicted nucleotide-binding protein (sugar kinase/HSP70/actin superfamily)
MPPGINPFAVNNNNNNNNNNNICPNVATYFDTVKDNR